METPQSFDVALVGLGVMGENLALNLHGHGFAVTGFDLEEHKRASFASRLGTEAPRSLQELVASLRAPRVLLLMVPAGAPVDAVLRDLRPLLHPGDVVIDGGNTRFTDTQRRIAELTGSGILYVGAGVSGGEEGALRGPSIMPGGDAQAWPVVRPLLQAIAARAEDDTPCCEWIGPGASGHFVKMVHNGIEYADMQTICEAYFLMQQLLGLQPREMSAVFAEWSRGELSSYLVDITADILSRTDPESGGALVDVIVDTAEQKGTGKWASQAALDLGVTAPTIADAVFARTVSAVRAERAAAAGVLAGPKLQFTGERAGFTEKIRRALLAAKICAYAQGFALLAAADREYSWDLAHGTIAGLWRAGCIIRARLLEDIRHAYARDAKLANLLVDPHFAGVMQDCQQALREVVATAALHGVPAPAFMSALAYYDSYRAPRLPANLLQAQRDYFGAHKYERLDRAGKFHTHWVD
ncbi:NADP-dependent phosphogluconate dehydrogenase [Ramlibacter alkalitolerans]|uniref:6-phosphogluconate dehydrogenase, decarboxylating n=1 Tax=Ramlibacter alkalitolerans TaxID=2039631 RepID=A0ABS1JSG7_9BURK|nr:NADP-dependent phosphogluconate dehydrogenase [Ramlibacter alkalitolerans]MBL0427091.1 NADP-dependent phosphogluconate dehydrogenase [Ramlibacter alkalitolerans]